jgi:excisionase family DNA binding protein
MPNSRRRRVTVAEAADRLAVSEKSIRRWVSSGRLRAYRTGPRLLRIDPADLDALSLPVPPDEPQDAA